MKRIASLVASLGLAAVAGGCVSDGAVRLAGCVEKAAYELYRSPELDQVRRPCDLRLTRESWVIAFPWAAVSSSRLYEEGLSREEVVMVTELQGELGVHARINVIPVQDPDLRRGRGHTTTYHDRFVDTPELLICSTDYGAVEVVVQRRGERPLLVGLEVVGSEPAGGSP